MSQFILWFMLIVPWLSLFFIKKSTRRFMPVAIFASLLVTLVFEISYTFHWWVVKEDIVPWGHITSFPLTYGVFIPGTIWIYHFSYDRPFWFYMITNAIIDALYAFIILNVFIYFGIYELKTMGNFGIFVLMIVISILIYVYQKWQEGNSTREQEA